MGSTRCFPGLRILAALVVFFFAGGFVPAAPAGFGRRVGGKGSPGYFVIVEKGVFGNPGWKRVAERLAARHGGRILLWEGDLSRVGKALASASPRYAVLVCPPSQVTRGFVVRVNRCFRGIDRDPFWDVEWGIVTGYNWWDALALAEWKEPLLVKRIAAGCGMDLSYVREGVAYSECTPGEMVTKVPGRPPGKGTCPSDTTRLLVEELNLHRPDAFFTSGHATNRDWQIGYSYPNGMFRCKEGLLYGIDLKNRVFPVLSPNPKVYSPAGNCLMGLMGSKETMAAAWLRSAGVKQMTGYVVSTWFGALWAVNDYFLRLQGRWTFAESFHLCQQAIVAELVAEYPRFLGTVIDDYDKYERNLNRLWLFARKKKVSSKRVLGLLWDLDTLVLYGDPAWDARLERVKVPDWSTKVDFDGKRLVFRVETRRDGSWCRFPAALLPFGVKRWKVLEGKDLNPVVADDYLALPFKGKFRKGEVFQVVLALEEGKAGGGGKRQGG